MIELWDLYDVCMEKTEKTHIRGQKVPADYYHLVVHIYPINKEGKLLIQKRADSLLLKPGIWAATGGAVIAGESLWEGCQRELKEEVGIVATKENSELVTIFRRIDHFTSVWLVHTDIPFNQIQLQKEEVSEVKWVSIEELKQMVKQGLYWNYDYMEWLLNQIQQKIDGTQVVESNTTKNR